jgi:hypothetical protein
MSRRDLIGMLAGGAILAFSVWGPLGGFSTPEAKAFLLLDGLIGLYIVAKATERLIAARFPPPPPFVDEDADPWEDEPADEDEEVSP